MQNKKKKKTEKKSFNSFNRMAKKKTITQKKKKVRCEECQKRTDDYYPIFTNKGRAFKCVECWENSIRRDINIKKLTCEKNSYRK